MGDEEFKKERVGYFKFEPHAKENQKLEKRNVEQYEKDYLVVEAEKKEFDAKLKEFKKQRLAVEEEEETKIKNLGDGEEFVDRTGTAIPYKQTKKLGLFTITESKEDYKKRMRSKVLGDYAHDVAFQTLARSTAEAQMEYYGYEGAVTRVDLETVRNNLSEQRRKMMKQALVKMAQEDLKAKKIESKEYADYKSFLEALIAYGNESGEVYLGEAGKYKADTSRVEKESALFAEALGKLEKLMEKQDVQKELIPSLNGYYDMLKHLADGGLKTESIKEHEVCEASTRIRYEDEREDVVKEQTGTPLFTHEPAISDLVQGSIGDCYLVAALTSMVTADPQLIKNCMKDNGDGSVTVRFFRTGINTDYEEGEDKKNMLISTPTYIKVPKVSITNRGGKNALWVNIMEIGYAEFKRQSDVRKSAVDGFLSKLEGEEKKRLKALSKKVKADYKRRKKEMFPDYADEDFRKTDEWSYINRMEQEILKEHEEEYTEYLKEKMEKTQKRSLDLKSISGGHESDVLASLTGHLHDRVKISLQKQDAAYKSTKHEHFRDEYTDKQKELFKQISDAIDARKCVTCATEFDKDGDSNRVDGLADSHAYTVLGTKTIKMGGRDVMFVRIRNPWGSLHTDYSLGGYSGNNLFVRSLENSATNGINEIELNDFYTRMQEVTITNAK